jgi:hypothetical protein
MSLDYDTTRIDEAKRAEVFPPDEAGKMHDALHVLIWITMAIDIGEITEKNVDEFWTRVWIWQKVVGSGFNKAVQVRPPVGTCDAVDAPPHEKDSTTVPCKDWTVTDDGLEWQPYLLTRDHVEAAVGLRTNVFPKSSKTEFMKKVYAAAERMCKA